MVFFENSIQKPKDDILDADPLDDLLDDTPVSDMWNKVNNTYASGYNSGQEVESENEEEEDQIIHIKETSSTGKDLIDDYFEKIDW